ncbi:AMP-binding protein [Dactylosporangium sp. CA-139066]|uniref:AMP-binding protein n=1 Tax=Dactylosporangium sp. CA-139066 TaxID=3239930 RepID=UPI003D90E73B
MVIPARAFDPAQTLDAVQRERCTVLYGVPTMFIAELALPDFAGYDVSSLRTGVMAGSPCPVHVMKRVIADMGMAEVTICYGMTETSGRLAHYKIPRYVKVVDAFPMTVTGKVRKVEMREVSARELGAATAGS